MTSPQSAVNQRSFHNQQRRQSKITVEYHRPSRESIQEYNALLAESNLQAAQAAEGLRLNSYVPARAAPPPPTAPSSFRSKTPTSSDSSPSSPSRARNSFQKPNTRLTKPNLPSQNPTPRIPEADPFAANANPNDNSLAQALSASSSSRSNGMHSSSSAPHRPSRANTMTSDNWYPEGAPNTAHGQYPTQSTHDDSHFHTDLGESLPSIPSSEIYSPAPPAPAPHFSNTGPRLRSSTAAKSKKGVLSFMSEVFNSSKRVEISTPYDPVHLTHVGFNSSTGEFTGLPKEWQQLLQESGISKTEQEKNPQAVMEIVKFYQEGHGDVWDKMGGAAASGEQPSFSNNNKAYFEEGFQNPVRCHLDLFFFFFFLFSGGYSYVVVRGHRLHRQRKCLRCQQLFRPYQPPLAQHLHQP